MSVSSDLGSTGFCGDVEVTRATVEEHAWQAGRLAALVVGMVWVVLSFWLAVDASWI
ncbi:MAG: hypothetical protein QOD30_656, partial [Actinomycetota bacterium]|nr:hypothetical protein [Actinomycetota bacterium]